MASAKVAVTIDERLLTEVDRWVAAGEFPNRSKAVQAAIECLRQTRTKQSRLIAELAKLDPREERELAEEWFVGEVAWPRY
jgi:Arc/MetJ-type ribon-helix-helix transcriptional regulator